MIRFIDATILAVTKLRMRRIRTIITVVISGLLFGCLIAALFVARGARTSIDRFNSQGLGSRYVVQAYSDPAIAQALQDEQLKKHATDIYNQTIASKKAAAAKLDIPYDTATEIPPVQSVPGSSSQTYLMFAAPAAQQAFNEYIQAHPGPTMADLQKVASDYHPIASYTSAVAAPADGTLATMVKGVEDFSPTTTSSGFRQTNDVLTSNQIQFIPPELTKPFILPKGSSVADPDAIPLVVPYAVAQQLLGLGSLPGNASGAQKLARIKELYAKAGAATLQACYRNSVSASQIQDAITTAAEIADNAKNKDYQKPHLIYGLPAADSCGPATIASDTRTYDEKILAAKQKQFDSMFGATVDPDQQKLTFKVVGLVPDQANGAPSNSAAGILQNLVGSSLSGIIAIPQDAYAKLPSVARYNAILAAPQKSIYLSSQTDFVEFGSASDAGSFIRNKSCTTGNDGLCSTAAKPFMLNAFGSNSIAIQDLQHKFYRIFQIAALVVIVVAIIIMSGTVGRMIADGRRETAVFRAVGAERIDIAVVYTAYTLFLSLFVAVFALLLGTLIAYIIDRRFWELATAQTQLAFGGSNLSLQFRFFMLDARALWVMLAAVGSGLVSMLLPLLRNIRRNPIKDMRDE